MGNRILVVDDEKEIADVIELYLKNEGFEVEKFYTGKDALVSIEKAAPDMALLDVMLPDIDGFEVLQKIREKYNFPVIMLTAKTEYMDKINGLMLGADDYMAKPFNPLELIARVKAQMRRFTKYNTGGRAQEDVIDFGNMFLNRTTHECIYNEKHRRWDRQCFSKFKTADRAGNGTGADRREIKYHENDAGTERTHGTGK